ncbi:MAG: PIG-L family deacetylase [Actinomycetota bacterium]|nr:PIG-L family deacetylase [Actinomycetota bacterium]
MSRNGDRNLVAPLGTILGVWAHPDDESYLSGAVMAVASDIGNRVVCLTATRGERGTGDPSSWPPARLAPLRDAELAAALAALGVAEHRGLDYPDGACGEVTAQEAVARIASTMAEVAPDTVLTFGPDGLTGHPDHRAVSAWTTAAFRRVARPGARLLYATTTPEWCDAFAEPNASLGVFQPGLPSPTPRDELALELKAADAVLERKLAALRAHSSQVEALLTALGEDTFRAWVADEVFRAAPVNPGAAFESQHETQAHLESAMQSRGSTGRP